MPYRTLTHNLCDSCAFEPEYFDDESWGAIDDTGDIAGGPTDAAVHCDCCGVEKATSGGKSRGTSFSTPSSRWPHARIR